MENATNRYLNALARKLGGVSDYRLSKVLGTSTSGISNYRMGRSTLDNTTAAKAAELLGLNPLEVIAAIEMDRAKTDETKQFWTAQAKKFAAVFLCAASIMLALAAPKRAYASTGCPPQPGFTRNIHYKFFGFLVRFVLTGFLQLLTRYSPNVLFRCA